MGRSRAGPRPRSGARGLRASFIPFAGPAGKPRERRPPSTAAGEAGEAGEVCDRGDDFGRLGGLVQAAVKPAGRLGRGGVFVGTCRVAIAITNKRSNPLGRANGSE
jgi:hypothetical protein